MTAREAEITQSDRPSSHDPTPYNTCFCFYYVPIYIHGPPSFSPGRRGADDASGDFPRVTVTERDATLHASCSPTPAESSCTSVCRAITTHAALRLLQVSGAGGCRERAWRCPCAHGQVQRRSVREGGRGREGLRLSAPRPRSFCMVFILSEGKSPAAAAASGLMGGRRGEMSSGGVRRTSSPTVRSPVASSQAHMLFGPFPPRVRAGGTCAGHSIMNARQARYADTSHGMRQRRPASAACQHATVRPIKNRHADHALAFRQRACLSQFDWVGSQPGTSSMSELRAYFVYTAIGVNESLYVLIG
jgi:hypothetical protein